MLLNIQKSRIQETLNILTDADSSTVTKKNVCLAVPIFFLEEVKKIKGDHFLFVVVFVFGGIFFLDCGSTDYHCFFDRVPSFKNSL